MGKGTFVGSFRSKIFTTNQNGRTNEEYTTVSAIDGCSDVDFVDDDEDFVVVVDVVDDDDEKNDAIITTTKTLVVSLW